LYMLTVARSIRAQVINFRPLRWFVYIFIKAVFSILCRVDAPNLHKFPASGPLIAVSIHTGSLEVPVMFTWLYPRPVTGWAKIETWNNPFMAGLFDLWGAIPVRRGEVDMFALRTALEKLEKGYIFGVAPEGTRNKTGKLLRAHPGAVTLAFRSNAPILPIAHWGGEKFLSNLKHLRRTDFSMRVGRPFTLNTNGGRITREQRQQIVDEMMYQLAALMPEEYRGEYSDMSKATTQYLKFES
ncbi:MAG TPA: lysophospholipid acyltransferase family protein, partial [Anaerolineales bacterium]|nr:lysophospholipid acyltransferase family protein [Anaerolineales bacterium]